MMAIVNGLILAVGMFACIALVVCGTALAVLVLFRNDPRDYIGERTWSILPFALCVTLAILGLALTKWAMTVL